MSLLSTLTNVSDAPIEPMKVTILGDAGTCKTSLGALFPRVLFLRTENGTKSIDAELKSKIKQTPVLTSSHDVIQWLSDIYNEPTGLKTLVFDSVTKMDSIIEDEVVANDPKMPKSIMTACGGFGGGYRAVAKVHREIKAWCDAISLTQNVNIVFIAHSKVGSLDSPDQDAYSKYGLKMGGASTAVYVDDVDMVAQTRMKTVVMKGKGELDQSKVKAIGGFIIRAHPDPSGVNKNRYQISKDIEFVRNVFPFQSIIDTGSYIENYVPVDKSTGEIKPK